MAAIERERPEIVRIEDGGCDGWVLAIEDPAWEAAVRAAQSHAVATLAVDSMTPEKAAAWMAPWQQLVELMTSAGPWQSAKVSR